jgi:small-conductance mechanosensitive channel
LQIKFLEFEKYYFINIGAAIIVAGVIFVCLKYVKSKILTQPSPENLALKRSHDLIQGLLLKTHWISLLAISLYFGTLLLKLPISASVRFGQGVFLVLLAQAGWWGSWWIGYWAKITFNKKKETDSAQASAIGLLKILGQTILGVFVLLAGLANLGFEVSTLIAGLGVGGIAIALASQKILSDLFASLTIILDRPFVVGDFIISNDMKGTVKKIGLKTTLARSLNGELLILPNSDLLEPA